MTFYVLHYYAITLFCMPTAEDFLIKTLGECKFDSPLNLPEALYVSDKVRVRYAAEIPNEKGTEDDK